MRFNFLYFILCLVILSCQEKSDKPPKDFGDVVPKAKSSQFPKRNDITHEIDSQKIKYYSSEIDLKIDSVNLITKNQIPDRFNPMSKTKEVLYFNSDSIQYFQWKYKDSTDLKRALFNLMDCFDDPCKPFKFYEKKNVSKKAFVIFCSSTQLIVLKSTNQLDLKQWISFIDKKKNITSFDVIIEQKRNEKTNWYEFENKELKIINAKK